MADLRAVIDFKNNQASSENDGAQTVEYFFDLPASLGAPSDLIGGEIFEEFCALRLRGETQPLELARAGATYVIEFTTGASDEFRGIGFDRVGGEAVRSVYWTTDFGLQLIDQAYAEEARGEPETLSAGRHKLAITMMDDILAVSIDGLPCMFMPIGPAEAALDLALLVESCGVQKISFYDPIVFGDFDELVALSTLEPEFQSVIELEGVLELTVALGD